MMRVVMISDRMFGGVTLTPRSTYAITFLVTRFARLEKQAAKLKSIQSPDGCWRASLLNVSGYPDPETTGSSSFTYGIACVDFA